MINLKCIHGELSGKDSRKNIIEDLKIVETEDSFRITSGSKEIIIPENALPSDENTGSEKINWIITLKGTLKSRPKIELDYRLRILAKRK
jgi:hypothetical protein